MSAALTIEQFADRPVRDGDRVHRAVPLDPYTAWRFVDPTRFSDRLHRGDLDAIEALVLDRDLALGFAAEPRPRSLPQLRALWVDTAVPRVRQFAPRLSLLMINGVATYGNTHIAIPPWRLEHETVTALYVDALGLPQDALEWVLDASLPSLTTLHLGLGAREFGATHTLDDLYPLLSGQRFSKLVELGLHYMDGQRIHGNFWQAIAGAPLLRRLSVLDLSASSFDGMLDDFDASFAPGLEIRREFSWTDPTDSARYIPSFE
ncbi:MAG: hypothetical protein JNK05_32345 [Myxococcales bacterium]|nr:hypothetical protein [Myxococcales bacterium]